MIEAGYYTSLRKQHSTGLRRCGHTTDEGTTHQVFQCIADVLAGLATLDNDGRLCVLMHLRLPLSLRTKNASLWLLRGDAFRWHNASPRCDPTACARASHARQR